MKINGESCLVGGTTVPFHRFIALQLSENASVTERQFLICFEDL